MCGAKRTPTRSVPSPGTFRGDLLHVRRKERFDEDSPVHAKIGSPRWLRRHGVAPARVEVPALPIVGGLHT
jgi:hypothetical protein